MKKILLILTFLTALFSVIPAQAAQLSPAIAKRWAEMSIGGIGIGSVMEYVESVYGKPDRIEVKDVYRDPDKTKQAMAFKGDVTFTTYYYGAEENLVVKFVQAEEHEQPVVCQVECMAPELYTPSHFHVSSPLYAIERKFLKLQVQQQLTPKDRENPRLAGCTIHYMMANGSTMRFFIDKHGFVKKIVILTIA